MSVKGGFKRTGGAVALPLIHSHVAEQEAGQQGAAEVVRTSLGVVASHTAALPHGEKSGTFEKRQRKMRWSSKQVGRQRGEDGGQIREV